MGEPQMHLSNNVRIRKRFFCGKLTAWFSRSIHSDFNSSTVGSNLWWICTDRYCQCKGLPCRKKKKKHIGKFGVNKSDYISGNV